MDYILTTAWAVQFVAWTITLIAALHYRKQRDEWRRIALYKQSLEG
jgi:hypothetical protein